MTYNFLTAGLQNVLLLLAVVELSSPFVNFCITLLIVFISIILLLKLKLSHEDIKIRLMSTHCYNMKE